ncbi:hypothetical protein [Lederbergia panacisoli]|nr:hypothetical protein [Lederbergia panacisoli]MCR2820950.1 hypothetical protein [Lederbergia panacisoli]
MKNIDANSVEVYSGEELMTNGISIHVDEKWESHVLLIDLV